MVIPTRLTEEDLDFLVRTVATRRQDYDHIKSIVRDKAGLLEPMLGEGQLFQRVMAEEAWARLSPYLFFSILLRQAWRDLGKEAYTLERLSAAQRLPVFDSHRVSLLLEDPEVREYLVDMLASFSRAESAVVYHRQRGKLYRRSFSDMDMDDMLELSQGVAPQFRFSFYKRIADIALFIVGVFPDCAADALAPGSSRLRLAGRRLRTLEEYQEEGRRFYQLAAEQGEGEPKVLSALGKIAQNFELAKKPLSLVSERYIPFSRFGWFSPAV